MNYNKNNNIDNTNITKNTNNLENNKELEKNNEIQLQKKILEIKNKISNNLLRSYAEIENIKKQSIIKIEEIKQEQIYDFSKQLIKVIDKLETITKKINTSNNSSKAIIEGISLTLQSLFKTTEKNGLKKQNELQTNFNPENHHFVIDEQSIKLSKNHTVTTIKPGYTLNGQILRKSIVKSSANN